MSDPQSCIITQPVTPPNSLSFSVSVDQGISKLLKHQASVFAYYPTSVGLNVQTVSIAASGSYTPTVSIASLFINVVAPVQLTTHKSSVASTVTVNQMYFCDSGFDSITIVNPSSTEVANVFIAYTE